MQPVESKANQEKHVTQGLALGVLAAGVEVVTPNKLAFEFAFTSAWRQFPHAGRFPVILSANRANPIYLLNRSERRRGPLVAAWTRGERGWEPYIYMDEWELDESGEMLAEFSGVSWSAWQTLGSDFVAGRNVRIE